MEPWSTPWSTIKGQEQAPFTDHLLPICKVQLEYLKGITLNSTGIQLFQKNS